MRSNADYSMNADSVNGDESNEDQSDTEEHEFDYPGHVNGERDLEEELDGEEPTGQEEEEKTDGDEKEGNADNSDGGEEHPIRPVAAAAGVVTNGNNHR